LLNSICSCFLDIALSAYGGPEFDLSGSRDVIGHVTIWFPIGHFLSLVFGTKPLNL